MNDFAVALIWIGFLTAIFFGWYFYIKARNKERMALIEQGKDVSEIFSKSERKIKVSWLKFGLLVTGIGFGLCLSLSAIMIPPIKAIIYDVGPVFPISVMILFGGLGIIIGYYLDKAKK